MPVELESLQPVPASRVEMLTKAAERYARAGFLADEYLDSRGIDQATSDGFGLGVVTDPIPEHDYLDGWLSIPYRNHAGNVMKIRFRCIEDHDGDSCRDLGHGKYLDIGGERQMVFNAGAILDADDEINICEGEMDAIILTQLGLPAVAFPGSKSWHPHHKRMLAGFRRVHIWADPDDAGRELADRIRADLPEARVIPLHLGDVGETFLRGGVYAINEALDRLDEAA